MLPALQLLVKISVRVSGCIITAILFHHGVEIINQLGDALSRVGAYIIDGCTSRKRKVGVSSSEITFFFINLGGNPDYRFGKLICRSSRKPAVLTACILDKADDVRVMGGDSQGAPISSLLHILAGCIDKIPDIFHSLRLVILNLFIHQTLDQGSLSCSRRTD